MIQINVIRGDRTPPPAYALQAGIIANLVSDETHHIPMPSRVEVLSDQDAVLYWLKPLCQREAQEVVDAVATIEKWVGKEAAISAYALLVTEAEELVRREHRKNRERRRLERWHLNDRNNCNNSAAEQYLLRVMNTPTGLKKWRCTCSRMRCKHHQGRDQWPSGGGGDSSGGSPDSSLGQSTSSFSRRSSQPTTRNSDDDATMMLSSITLSRSS